MPTAPLRPSCADLDLRPEGVGVALQDGLHRALPRRLVLSVVQARHAVARLAVAPRRKALAVPADTGTAPRMTWEARHGMDG